MDENASRKYYIQLMDGLTDRGFLKEALAGGSTILHRFLYATLSAVQTAPKGR